MSSQTIKDQKAMKDLTRLVWLTWTTCSIRFDSPFGHWFDSFDSFLVSKIEANHFRHQRWTGGPFSYMSRDRCERKPHASQTQTLSRCGGSMRFCHVQPLRSGTELTLTLHIQTSRDDCVNHRSPLGCKAFYSTPGAHFISKFGVFCRLEPRLLLVSWSANHASAEDSAGLSPAPWTLQSALSRALLYDSE